MLNKIAQNIVCLPQEFMGLLLLTSNPCRIPPMLFQANWKVFLKISVKFEIKYFFFFFFFFLMKAFSVSN